MRDPLTPRELLDDLDWDQRELYRGILRALRALEDRLPGTARQVAHVHSELSREDEFRTSREENVVRALGDLAGASKGALALRGTQLVLNTSLDELEVRVGAMLGTPGEPRRPSTFRSNSD